MIIDCHYHFDQRLLAEDKLLKKMDGPPWVYWSKSPSFLAPVRAH